MYRNRIPGCLLRTRHLLTHVKITGWFLDLCSGYQTNRAVAEMAGLRYIAADIAEIFKLGSGPNAKVATAGVAADLTLIDPEDRLKEIERKSDSH